MNIKSGLKYVWLGIAALSMILTIFLWCSLFAVLVVVLANHYLGINPFSTEGIYLSTIFLFVVGLMQWFWIARFWSPSEAIFQNLNLRDAKID